MREPTLNKAPLSKSKAQRSSGSLVPESAAFATLMVAKIITPAKMTTLLHADITLMQICTIHVNLYNGSLGSSKLCGTDVAPPIFARATKLEVSSLLFDLSLFFRFITIISWSVPRILYKRLSAYS